MAAFGLVLWQPQFVQQPPKHADGVTWRALHQHAHKASVKPQQP
jgi:hypothetical protein